MQHRSRKAEEKTQWQQVQRTAGTGGEENNVSLVCTVRAMGELSVLQGTSLHPFRTYITEGWLRFSSSPKTQMLLFGQEQRAAQSTARRQHSSSRHCTRNTLPSLHAALQSPKRQNRTRKGNERNRHDQSYKSGSVQGTKETWIFQPGRQMIEVVSKRSVINGAA